MTHHLPREVPPSHAAGRLGELLEAVAAHPAPGHAAAPLRAIHARVRRRRIAAAAAAAVVVAVLAAGVSAGQRLAGGPGWRTPVEPAATPTETRRASLRIDSAMVASDDVTITLHAGLRGCRSVTDAQAQVVEESGAEVEVWVTARTRDATGCETDGTVVPLTLTLPAPLGERTLVDTITGRPTPVYFERHLPDVRADSRWSGCGASEWQFRTPNWYGSCSGSGGSTLELRASSAGPPFPVDDPVETVTLGPHQGSVYELNGWIVTWEVGQVTYGLRLIPREGGSVTLEQFTQELALRSWS